MDMSVDDWLKQEFPGLHIFGYHITSPPTRQYNCIAWAANRNDKWWWPIRAYWPGHGREDETPKSFVKAFAELGYNPCESDLLEVGFEKVAIYVGSNGLVTHMARQLPDGRWTSKLGENVDVAHNLDGLCGDRYGKVGKILRRPRQVSN
jgi:hypothetical protein